MEDKLCPYCYKSIKGNYGTVDEDFVCPHPNCGKTIPKIYLQYPVRHVVSISNKENFSDYGFEISEYAKNKTIEFTYSRVENYTVHPSVQLILFEYLREEFSNTTDTVVLAIHRYVWNDNTGIPISDINHAASILLNIDITELKALFFNVGIERSVDEFSNWIPGQTGRFIRAVSDYLRRNQLSRKVAVLFGNLQELANHPYVREDNQYQKLLEITQEWTSDYADRKWIMQSDKIIRNLLLELGEERLIKDADTMADLKFFLYPSSKYRMTSNTFWMMAVLLWICVKIDE